MKIFKYFIIFSCFGIFCVSCAKVVAPTGGEKDEEPPKIVSSLPTNYSTNFNEKKIIIRFDEFINLENVTQELLVNPVQEEQPLVKLRNKNLIIQLKDSLIENTTYNLNFYDAIKDVNEGNVLKNYQYIFSTGNIIDTLFIVGHVYDAFNLEYVEDVFVMLYKNLADSAPKTQKPFYVTRTDETGSFSINSIAPGSYKLFALKDANRNMLFDQPSESIAFIDSLINPKVKLQEIFDTVQVFNNIDSVFYDSIFSKIVVVPATNELHLMLFTEDFENQFIEESKREKDKQLTIKFNRDLKDTVKFTPLNFVADSSWFVYESNKNHDQVTLWIIDSNIYKKDSIYLAIEYLNKDSLENWVREIDSVNFLFVEKEVKEKSRKEKRKELLEQDTIKSKIPSELTVLFGPTNYAVYDIGKPFDVRFNYPLKIIDTSKISFVTFEDTIEIAQQFKFVQDSIEIRKYYVETELLPEYDYRFIADSGAFVDIFDNINDSTAVKFRIKKEEKYGTVFLTLQDFETPGILQILSDKEEVLRELQTTPADSSLEIKYLLPKKYRLKYIVDRNNNKKWDTGKYNQHLQPEPVFYYPQEIEVKENWDYEITWNLLLD